MVRREVGTDHILVWSWQWRMWYCQTCQKPVRTSRTYDDSEDMLTLEEANEDARIIYLLEGHNGRA